MESIPHVSLLKIDYSRCVSINIEGLASVLSGFNASISSLEERLEQILSTITQYFLHRMTAKDADLADENMRLKSRVLKCERESEKAKEIPDMQYEIKEMQFTITKLGNLLKEQEERLSSQEDKIGYSLAKVEDTKAWLNSRIKDSMEDFENDVVKPFQKEVTEEVKAQVLRMQEELKQTLVPSPSAKRSMRVNSESEFESPQLIFSKIANLHSRVKRLEDAGMTQECSIEPLNLKDEVDQLKTDYAEVLETMKALTQVSSPVNNRRKQTSKVALANGAQNVYVQRIEEIQKAVEGKASIDQVVLLEGQFHLAKIFDRLESLSKVFVTRNNTKSESVLHRIQEVEDRVGKIVLSEPSEDAMFIRKPLGRVQCASCSKEVKRPLGKVLFSSWKKMTLTDGVGKRGFSQTLSSATQEDINGRPSTSFGMCG